MKPCLTREDVEQRYEYLYDSIKYRSDLSPVYLRELRDMALQALAPVEPAEATPETDALYAALDGRLSSTQFGEMFALARKLERDRNEWKHQAEAEAIHASMLFDQNADLQARLEAAERIVERAVNDRLETERENEVLREQNAAMNSTIAAAESSRAEAVREALERALELFRIATRVRGHEEQYAHAIEKIEALKEAQS